MEIVRRYLLLVLAVFAVIQRASAQEIARDNILNVHLPPIDSLYEGAKRSSMVEYYGLRMQGQELALKTERRNWLHYFTIYGTYQYGVMGMNSYTDLGSNYPMIYQNTGGEQLWYNLGATIGIPLDHFFDRRNRIRIQQLKLRETSKERDMWYDDQKIKILELYNRAQRVINELKLFEESAVLAKAQYTLIEKDFIMGKATSQGLSTAKAFEVQTLLQLEDAKQELKTAIMTLEILSNTKILVN